MSRHSEPPIVAVFDGRALRDALLDEQARRASRRQCAYCGAGVMECVCADSPDRFDSRPLDGSDWEPVE